MTKIQIDKLELQTLFENFDYRKAITVELLDIESINIASNNCLILVRRETQNILHLVS